MAERFDTDGMTGLEAGDVGATAQAFVTARRAARALADYPGHIPATLTAAYAVQDAAITARGGAIAGWKVGRIMPPLDAQFGSNRLAGPIFADRVRDADSTNMTMFAGGFGAVEAEFLFELGKIDPDRSDYSLSQALDCVVAAHVGIEIASSPFAGINELGPAVTVSDFGNNNGLIVGSAIPDWRARDLDAWDVVTVIDGAEAGRNRAAAFPDGLAGSIRFLLEHLAARGIAPPPGSWISSGAVTGVHSVEPGARATARFGTEFTLACTIAAEEPHG